MRLGWMTLGVPTLQFYYSTDGTLLALHGPVFTLSAWEFCGLFSGGVRPAHLPRENPPKLENRHRCL